MRRFRVERRIRGLEKLVGRFGRLDIGAVIDEMADWHPRGELGKAALGIAMPGREDDVIDLAQARVLCCLDDPSNVARCSHAAIACIDEQRFTGWRDKERTIA